MNIMLITLFISMLGAQIVPFEISSPNKIYLEGKDRFLVLNNDQFNNKTNIDLKYFSNYYEDLINVLIEIPISLSDNYTLDLIVEHNKLPHNTKVFLLDLNDDDIIGPFKLSKNSSNIHLGPIEASQFLLQYIIPRESYNSDFRINLISILDKKSHKINNESIFRTQSNRERPAIVVTGFWPPTNEMIRHFSQDQELNPSGWEGENWDNLGYDIISFFPEFDDPDCSNCGQGNGNFEVDYQDTSYDFWRLVNELNPIAVITFSRGYIDNSWELEYNYYNRVNWYNDYSSPFLPTPNPPDSYEPTMFLRNSNLPMQNIMDTINNNDSLGLNSYIDINGDPGRFVSEFMGYHGVWYRDLNQFSDNICYLAGHVHVGGLIDWDTATLAAEITIMEVIQSLDEYVYIPGDTNSDDQVNVLDIILIVSHVLGQNILVGVPYYAADMNADGIINIQDIIFVVNLIIQSN